MGTFNALLFGAAHPGAGSRVAAHFDGDQLVIDAIRLNSDQIVVSVGGVDQPQLFLNWQD